MSGQRYEDFSTLQKKKLKSCNKYTKTHHLCPKLPYLTNSQNVKTNSRQAISILEIASGQTFHRLRTACPHTLESVSIVTELTILNIRTFLRSHFINPEY